MSEISSKTMENKQGKSISNEAEGNKMGIASVPKLLLSMGIPMMISMAIQAVYNIVDSYFVSVMKGTDAISNMGEYGVNALTLAFPIQMFMVAIGVGTGVGINAVLSRRLGEGNRKEASNIAGNAVFLGACTYIAFLIFGLFGVKAYISSQTNDPIILNMGSSYLRICCTLSFGIIFYMIYEKLLQGTGRTMLATIAQIAGALTNIILDPILINGLGFIPSMGIEGAAYATVIGQVVSFLLDVYFHYVLDKDLDAGLKYLIPKKRIIIDIYRVGLPAIIMQAVMSVMTYVINIIFGHVSVAAVTAYGIYYKIQQFVFFAATGMNNAMIPVISFNYGRQDKSRVNQAIKYGMIYTLIIMIVGFLILQIFAHPLIGIFSLSEETISQSILAIRIVTLGFLFIGANVAYQGVFQALGYGVHSLIVSLIRQVIVVLPLAYLLSLLENAKQVMWIAFPIAEGAALVVAVIFMRQIRHKVIDRLK